MYKAAGGLITAIDSTNYKSYDTTLAENAKAMLSVCFYICLS